MIEMASPDDDSSSTTESYRTATSGSSSSTTASYMTAVSDPLRDSVHHLVHCFFEILVFAVTCSERAHSLAAVQTPQEITVQLVVNSVILLLLTGAAVILGFFKLPYPPNREARLERLGWAVRVLVLSNIITDRITKAVYSHDKKEIVLQLGVEAASFTVLSIVTYLTSAYRC